MDFEFKPNTLYKVSYRRTYRPADNGVIIGSFLQEMKWGCEFGHAMDVELERVTSGTLNLERDSIFRVEPTTETELALWRTLAFEMMKSVVKIHGNDPCYENVSKVTNYTIMERKLRREPLNYEKVWENIVTAIGNYLEKNNLESMILGVSGGIDSTVNAAIGAEVAKRTGKKLIGLSLMTPTNAMDEIESALTVGKEFCYYYSVTHMENEFEALNRMCEDVNGPNTNISSGNIKARMRMLILFDASAKHKGIVFSGANQTEVQLGFSTIGADSIGGIAPISFLFKHEVYEFAQWIKDNIYPDSIALDKAIAIIPTDGNGVMAGGDMAQIAPGFTYNEVDKILFDYLTGIEDGISEDFIIDKLSDNFPREIVEKVIKRHKNSQFKRWFLPLAVDPENGELLQTNAQPI